MYRRGSQLDTAWQPALDVCETADAYLIKVDVPGVRESDLRLDFADNVLKLVGERRRPYEANSTRMHRIEREYGAFERRVRLPEDIDPGAVEATLEHGVLSIRIGKRAAKGVVQIRVKRGEGAASEGDEA
ncbi:MAG: Hsp20/alpha crystallin family protein [Anaerolineae bacterium]